MTTDASQIASRALVGEVRAKVRERGLVLWLDTDKQYTELVDKLAGGGFDFGYPVVPFRGSYLELMLALEPYANGAFPDHVLVHLPGLNKDTVKETPVYELYKAGVRFEKNLATLVREAAVGVATPDEVDTFVRAPGLRLGGADEWLASLRAEPRDRLSLLIESLGLDDVVLGIVADDGRIRPHLPTGGKTLLAYLEKTLGMNDVWRTFRIGAAELSPAAMSALVASWLMAVEFVHDLKEAPHTPALAPLAKLGPFAKECRRLAARLRDQLPDVYEQAANELQDLLEQERTGHHADALGAIDTFRFEESTTRAAALAAIARGDWGVARGFAADRTTEQCFWVKRAPPLQRVWEIIRLAAAAGSTLVATEAALGGCQSLDEAVERYADRLAPVDHAHRIFEQRANALITSDLDDYDALLAVRAAVRGAYRRWADATNRVFFELCRTHGVLPGRSLRQRAVYEDVVQPLVEGGGRVALFMVDAMRFEMAQALAQELKREKYTVTLGARLAELPTETVVGMNALAPVEKGGRLRLVIKNGDIQGFGSNETTVSAPADRVQAMSERSVGIGQLAEDLELETFPELSLAKLRGRLNGKPNLVVVRSRDLDTAGEHGLHLTTFEQTLVTLKSAIALLSQAGVERFVVVSDHGFLLQDATVANIPFGVSKRVPQRRHALSPQPSGMSDVLEVKLSSLEYDVPAQEDAYLVLRPDTALWQTKDKVAPFVHGGNSLQERVIPVLVLERHVARGKTTTKYEVVARAEPSSGRRQQLKIAVRLQQRETAALSFLAPKTISLALRVPERPELAITLVGVGDPASLREGRILVPPNREEATVEFEIEGPIDEKVQVQVFHPDAAEDVKSKVVEGFFDVARDRRAGKPRSSGESTPPPANATSEATAPPPAAPAAVAPKKTKSGEWAGLVEDVQYRRVLEIIEERRIINEEELVEVLGNPTRVRIFSRRWDELRKRLPFDTEVLTVNGMKAYARKD